MTPVYFDWGMLGAMTTMLGFAVYCVVWGEGVLTGYQKVKAFLIIVLFGDIAWHYLLKVTDGMGWTIP